MMSKLQSMYASFLNGGELNYSYLEEVVRTSQDRREKSLALDLLQVREPIPKFGNVRWMLEKRNSNILKKKLQIL